MSEAMRISFPDGTKKRIAALGIPGGAPDFIRWAVEAMLQDQERQVKRGTRDIPGGCSDIFGYYEVGEDE